MDEQMMNNVEQENEVVTVDQTEETATNDGNVYKTAFLISSAVTVIVTVACVGKKAVDYIRARKERKAAEKAAEKIDPEDVEVVDPE